MAPYRRKLIEVALPLDAINKESAREKSIRHGHPSTLHLWWARRPLAACRAILFAQLVDDPSAWPEDFPTEEAQTRERARLFDVIRELVKWENTNFPDVLGAARQEIARSVARGRAANGEGDDRDARILSGKPNTELLNAYLAEVAPPVLDPFAGGGSIPVEAQRLGLRAFASDLNPVAVLINKAMIEIPPRFAGCRPVNPQARKLLVDTWHGSQGMSADIQHYGEWVRDEARKRVGHLYPEIALPEKLGGGTATVIAWLWVRTVATPNPAFQGIHVPLAPSFWLCQKKGKETWVEPEVDIARREYRFAVRFGPPKDPEIVESGTKSGRGGNFRCLLSGEPIPAAYVRGEGRAGRMGIRLLAVVAAGDRRRLYIPPEPEMEALAASAAPSWAPEYEFVKNSRHMTPWIYGLDTFGKLFTPRQLASLNAFVEAVGRLREKVLEDADSGDLSKDSRPLAEGGVGPAAYADAVVAYMALGVSRLVNRCSNLSFWHTSGEKVEQVFARQALSMTWDFAEANPFSDSSGNFLGQLRYLTAALDGVPSAEPAGVATKCNAAEAIHGAPLISTDPPYYDNVPYADLADFFYVWLRRMLEPIFPDLCSTILVPKQQELVVDVFRHPDPKEAERFFTDGMTAVLEKMASKARPDFPVAIYYAFRQSEKGEEGYSSTGWETFLEAVTRAGFMIDGTWPVRTELSGNLKKQKNALASSIVLACRKRPSEGATITRGDYRRFLRAELPQALRTLQHGHIAPVDLAQASIGPGMAIFSRHAKVLEPDGTPMKVGTALALINQTLDELLAEQEGDFDPDTRWAVAWFEQFAYAEGPFGVAETLSKAKNTSVEGLVTAGILRSRAGAVRLLRRDEMSNDWDPSRDQRLTIWEVTQYLIRSLLDGEGEREAGALAARIPGQAEVAIELAYRLYTICERKKWAQDAMVFNSLVVAWPEITRLAAQAPPKPVGQQEMF